MRQLTKEQAKEMDIDCIYRNGDVVFIGSPKKLVELSSREIRNKYFRDYYKNKVKPKRLLKQAGESEK